MSAAHGSTPPHETPSRPWTRHRLRVPREDGTLYDIPRLAQGLTIAQDNRAILEDSTLNLQGRTLARMRTWAREAVLAAARDYTVNCLGVRAEDIGELPADRMFVAGHQPSLFHPGVWVKNFALGGLAARAGAVGLNLVVDNDTVSSMAIRVPAGTREAPRWSSVAYDQPRPQQPWEDARIVDRDLFTQFADNVRQAIQPWGWEPLVSELWPAAIACSNRSSRLADCLTAARHQQERRWGLRNVELPISQLCRLDPFLWFTSHLLAQLPRFRETHNQILREYRQVNRVRSHSHPVPDLIQNGDWHEAPFWVWGVGDEHRARLFARQEGGEVVLSNGKAEFARLPLAPDMDACCAVEVLRDLEARGIHLRTRALTTTLFSRLCLADLFLHGIGGAKYDEMTDRIICRFYGLPTPGFLMVSATLHLPLQPFATREADERAARRRLRDLELNPECELVGSPDPTIQHQLQDLQAHLTHVPARSASDAETRRARHQHHVRLRELKTSLADAARPLRVTATEDRERILRELQANTILRDREYSLCLYPPARLRSWFSNLLPADEWATEAGPHGT